MSRNIWSLLDQWATTDDITKRRSFAEVVVFKKKSFLSVLLKTHGVICLHIKSQGLGLITGNKFPE